MYRIVESAPRLLLRVGLLGAIMGSFGCKVHVQHTVPGRFQAPDFDKRALSGETLAVLPLVQSEYTLEWGTAFAEAVGWWLPGKGPRSRRAYTPGPRRVIGPARCLDVLESSGQLATYAGVADRLLANKLHTDVTITAVGMDPFVKVTSDGEADHMDLPPSALRAVGKATEARYALVVVLHHATGWTHETQDWFLFIPLAYTAEYAQDVRLIDLLLYDTRTGRNVWAVRNLAINGVTPTNALGIGLARWYRMAGNGR